MNKIIKVIDLLIKIANGEDVPKQIKYKGEIYSRRKNIVSNMMYYKDEHCNFLLMKINSSINLNDTVEIIEENKKIEKIDKVWNIATDNGNEVKLFNYITELKVKINELVDEVNKLKLGE